MLLIAGISTSLFRYENVLQENGPFIPSLSKPGMNGRSLFGAGWVGMPFQTGTISVRALLLNIAFYRLTAHVACCRKEIGKGPQRGQFPQMGKFLAQEA